MNITLISPNLVAVRHDYISTGIVYMPICMVSTATCLAQEHQVTVIDSFGEAPWRLRRIGHYLLFGLSPEEIRCRIPSPGTDLFFLYADRLISHVSLVEIIDRLRTDYPGVPIAVFENPQAVTAYALKYLQAEFWALGVDHVITGDPEFKAMAWSRSRKESTGTAGREEVNCSEQTVLEQLPFPDWSLIPLANYWRLKYAHGPFETRRYLPLLTSRGCPYDCRFCVMPAMNDRRWEGHRAARVVDEMEWNLKQYGVREFHLEDANPTVSEKRMLDICDEIERRRLSVIWKLVSGTKIETLKDPDTLRRMRRAGCRYISISPESGSPRMLRLMNKEFDVEHACNMIRVMRREGIVSQACFILGFPGEQETDVVQTRALIGRLARMGVNEILVSIVTPVPGSAIYSQIQGFTHYSELNFSPAWRKDYSILMKQRIRLYTCFLCWKLLTHPLDYLHHLYCLVFKRFRTKMEMTFYRLLVTSALLIRDVMRRTR